MNVWESFDFSENNVTVYSLLASQEDYLKAKTAGLLTQHITQTLGGVYFYIVAPNLGNFRKNLFIINSTGNSHFPVDICSIFDDHEELGVTEEEFLDKMAELLLRPEITNVIKSLYNSAYRQLNDN